MGEQISWLPSLAAWLPSLARDFPVPLAAGSQQALPWESSALASETFSPASAAGRRWRLSTEPSPELGWHSHPPALLAGGKVLKSKPAANGTPAGACE